MVKKRVERTFGFASKKNRRANLQVSVEKDR